MAQSQTTKGELKGPAPVCLAGAHLADLPVAPHLVADRLGSLDSRILGQGVPGTQRWGLWRRPRLSGPQAAVTSMQVPAEALSQTWQGPETDSASNALLASCFPRRGLLASPPAGQVVCIGHTKAVPLNHYHP